MFGRSESPKSIPEAKGYTTIKMTVCITDSGNSFTLERSLLGGGFKIHRVGLPVGKLLSKHGGGNSLSEYLLNLIGMSGKKVQVNKNGKTRDISFRDIARLCVVNEEDIISSESPFLSGIPTSATAEKGVFKSLLTGIDYSSVVEVEDKKISRSILAGKSQMLDLLIQEAIEKRDFITESLDNVDLNKKLAEHDDIRNEVQESLKSEIEQMEYFEAERSHILNKIRTSESSLIVQREIKSRFELLEQQYISDLRRLENTAEAAFLLDQLPDSACPVCGAEPNEQHKVHESVIQSPSEISEACSMEAQKIHVLMVDLKNALNNCAK